MTIESKHRVMIVDDHELVRDGLRQLINRQDHLTVCGEAANEHDAQQVFREHKPDLVIVDLTLPEGSGLDLIKWISQRSWPAKVIVSTMRDEKDYGERALRAGAVGYVNKQEPAHTLLEAVEKVLAGGLFFTDDLSQRLMRRAASPKSVADSPLAALSDRELEIYTLIGEGLSTDEIGRRLHLSPNTIGTYRERLKTKLNMKTAAELTHQAILWVASQG